MKKARENPKLSIVIPSRANTLDLLEKLFHCLKIQTFQDFELIVVCDRFFSEKERKDFQAKILSLNRTENQEKIRLISHLNSDFKPQSPGRASYVRNQGIKAAKGEFIQLFDDDNEFDENYLEQALAYHEKFGKKYGKEVFITPSLMRRDTETIQNQGFSDYTYRFARPQIHFLKPEEAFAEIKMFSGNGIFGNAEIMKATLYDEQIAWIAEDLDFVYSIWKQGYPILVFRDLKVRHQEREKTILEQAWIGNAQSAQQKIRNLFIWTKKHGNLNQTLIFFLWSSWGICIWLSFKAFLYGKQERWKIVGGIWKGYIQGWKKYFLQRNS